MQGAFVSLGGQMLSDAVLQRVVIQQRLNDHSYCELECRSTMDRPIPGEDALGAACVITNTAEDGSQHTSFSGIVIDVALKHEVWGSYTCVLRAASTSWLHDRSPRNARFNGSLAAIAGNVDASSAVPDKPSPAEYVQYNETDWQFLLRVADDHGGWISTGLGETEVRDSFDAAVPLIFRDHSGLLEFHIEGQLRPAKIAAAHYDTATFQSSVLPGETKTPQFEQPGQAMASAVQSGSSSQALLGFSSRSRSMTNADLQTRAQFDAERAQGGAVTAGGVSRTLGLAAGGSVDVQNLGDANGTWNLVEVTHTWTQQEYSNTFRATPWKQWRHPHPPPRTAAPGVQVARVVSNVDPDQRGRLVVSLFWQGNALLLAPMASLHCGAGFGWAITPEVGDEVLVSFQDADPERPIILGSLWNAMHQPPRDQFATGDESIDSNNYVKRLVTKSGIRIHLTDTPGKQSISFATPTSNHLILSENVAETGRPAIGMETQGDIILRAAGRVHYRSAYHSAHVDNHEPVPVNVEFRRTYWDGTPIANLPYTLTLADGTKKTGRTDGSGFVQHSGVRAGSASVIYGDNKNTPKSSTTIAIHDDFADLAAAATPSSPSTEGKG
ncbi:MAG: phage baseplate assembly protein V [Janthinobacterium lividum]